MNALADSTVFVVDGDHAVGLDIAHRLVRVGVQRIGLISADAERGTAAATEIFRSASGIWALSASGDHTSPDDARRMVEELASSLGDPDIVVDCSSHGTAVTEHSGPATAVRVGDSSASDVVEALRTSIESHTLESDPDTIR